MSKTPISMFKLEDIRDFSYQTPYFLFSKEAVQNNMEMYRANLPTNTEICYAMKANSEEPVLRTLAVLGSSFEVASEYELRLLKKIGVRPEQILCGTAVKSVATIREFYEYGVDRYAFDSEQELERIAKHAPRSKVYVRVLVNDKANSVFTMSEKFGAVSDAAADLLVRAVELGMEPYGISFNVGSQARNANAWANSIHDVATILQVLLAKDIKVQVVDLGGGFPYSYQDNDDIPAIEEIGHHIREASSALPYPVDFIAEPGRGLVADAYVLVTSVFAKNLRDNGHWLYVNAGAYNALLEAMAYQGTIRYRIDLLRPSEAPLEPYIITGPTGDSLDIVGTEVLLPNDVTVDDRLVIHDAGAYSFTLTTLFNGFPTPLTYELETR
jgi:ornithine decarboxylase